MLSLERKIAVITGGTSGIGARTAALFVEEGARVVIAGRRRERGEQLARALGEFARFVRTDVAVEADVRAMIKQTITWFGRIDCLVNNAGTGSQWVRIAEVDLDRFDAAIAVHVRGALAAMKYAVPIMAAQRSGSIITVASVNGVRAGLGGLYYSVAKAAAIHLTRCAAVELGEKGIRINTVSPGPIATGIFGKAPASNPMKQTRTPTTPKSPSPRSYPGGNRCPMSGVLTTSLKPCCFSRATRRAWSPGTT